MTVKSLTAVLVEASVASRTANTAELAVSSPFIGRRGREVGAGETSTEPFIFAVQVRVDRLGVSLELGRYVALSVDIDNIGFGRVRRRRITGIQGSEEAAGDGSGGPRGICRKQLVLTPEQGDSWSEAATKKLLFRHRRAGKSSSECDSDVQGPGSAVESHEASGPVGGQSRSSIDVESESIGEGDVVRVECEFVSEGSELTLTSKKQGQGQDGEAVSAEGGRVDPGV